MRLPTFRSIIYTLRDFYLDLIITLLAAVVLAHILVGFGSKIEDRGVFLAIYIITGIILTYFVSRSKP